MNSVRALWTLHALLAAAAVAHAFDPITAAAAGSLAALGIWGIDWVIRQHVETCNSDWISFNATGLKSDLENKLYGQHIASHLIFEAVSEFKRSENPQKPLVLSLHGTTGTGKNFVSRLIAENIYRKGMESRYVHVLLSAELSSQPSKLVELTSKLEGWIADSATACQQSLFVFDEIDKMHPALIDVIKAQLDQWGSAKEMPQRKSIFLLLSNAGGESITETSLQFWKGGWDREEIQLEDLKPSLSLPVFNARSDFSEVSLVDKRLIDVFVPFLPLEFKHVVQCAMNAMEEEGVEPDQEVAEKLANDLVYSPKPELLFSAAGCKTVKNRVSFYLHDNK